MISDWKTIKKYLEEAATGGAEELRMKIDKLKVTVMRADPKEFDLPCMKMNVNMMAGNKRYNWGHVCGEDAFQDEPERSFETLMAISFRAIRRAWDREHSHEQPAATGGEVKK